MSKTIHYEEIKNPNNNSIEVQYLFDFLNKEETKVQTPEPEVRGSSLAPAGPPYEL